MARTVTTNNNATGFPNTVAGRMAYIWRFLVGNLHLTPAQAAGVEGNWQVESGFDPTAFNPRENAIGFGQWEGGRRTALQAFARARGTSETNPLTQLLFFAREARARGNLAALRRTTNATDAAYVIQHDFEVSDPSTLGTRQANARTIFASASKYGTPHPLAGVGSVNGGLLGGVDLGSVLGDIGTMGTGGLAGAAIQQDITGAFSGILGGVVKIVFSGGAIGVVVLGIKQAAGRTGS